MIIEEQGQIHKPFPRQLSGFCLGWLHGCWSQQAIQLTLISGKQTIPIPAQIKLIAG